MYRHKIPENHFGNGNNPDESEERASFYDEKIEVRNDSYGK